MKKGLIKKKISELKSRPNLENYEKTYQTFNWKEAEKEYEKFPVYTWLPNNLQLMGK